MNVVKVMKFWKSRKSNQGKGVREELKNESSRELVKSAWADFDSTEADDDNEFINNELRGGLKEHGRNNSMMPIPMEMSPEDGVEKNDNYEVQEEGEENISELGDLEAGKLFCAGFDAVYDKYCERMLCFDHLQVQQLRELGSYFPSTPSPSPSRKSTYKKLVSTFHYLSLKKIDEPQDEIEHLHRPGSDPYQDLETAYVAQVCLTWEIIHCQYTQLIQKISSQPESSTTYNHCSQQFQQFQVLLQRFIENEPYEQGLRPEIYARMRSSLPILQVPKIQGSIKRKMEEELMVLAPDLIKIIEGSISTFHLFLNVEKKKSGGASNLVGVENRTSTPLEHIQSSLEKKAIKLKYQWKKKKNWKKKSRTCTPAGADLLLGLVDVEVMERVLRMDKITKEQLFWCEEKMKKLDLSRGKLQRDPSPLLFPC
nr:uncharacterized protein LOC109190249 isoform X1 [Ipomoea batatas]